MVRHKILGMVIATSVINRSPDRRPDDDDPSPRRRTDRV
jgi:hypothetical protein